MLSAADRETKNVPGGPVQLRCEDSAVKRSVPVLLRDENAGVFISVVRIRIFGIQFGMLREGEAAEPPEVHRQELIFLQISIKNKNREFPCFRMNGCSCLHRFDIFKPGTS